MKTPHRLRGEITTTLLLIAGGVTIVSLALGQWKPFKFLDKGPPVAELTQLQADLATAQAAAAAAREQAAALAAAERTRQEQQVRHAQQMTTGTGAALSRVADPGPEVVLALDLNRRADLALGLALGPLPPAQQAEILRIVDQALSTVAAERDAARAALAAKDVELRTVTQERTRLAAAAERAAADRAAAEAAAAAKDQEVRAVTEELKTWAALKDRAEREASTLGAQFSRLLRVATWLAVAWLFLVFILPGIVKHMDHGRAKTLLRDLSGYAANPLLYHDARKKLAVAAHPPSTG